MAGSRHAAVAAGAHLVPVAEATAKRGIGKLRQRNRGQVPYYEPWPTLKREAWRPDIRTVVLANQRIGIHRKLMKTAAAADLYPVAIGTDAIVYPSVGPTRWASCRSRTRASPSRALSDSASRREW
ncbi:hypothetical protein ACWD5F_04840 [Streptomyces sp. NPDC002499]